MGGGGVRGWSSFVVRSYARAVGRGRVVRGPCERGDLVVVVVEGLWGAGVGVGALVEGLWWWGAEGGEAFGVGVGVCAVGGAAGRGFVAASRRGGGRGVEIVVVIVGWVDACWAVV